MKKKKVKRVSYPALKAKVWKLKSLLVRYGNSKNGIATCYTCGTKKKWKKMHAGHFVEKSTCTLNGYFSEAGVQVQCPQCNMFKSGNKDQYAYQLEKEFGVGIVTELVEESKRPVSNEYSWLLDKEDEYKQRLKDIGVYL